LEVRLKASRLIILILTLASFSGVSARTVVVPSDYQSIQEGINSCSNGDTVLVEPGTYYENIDYIGLNIVVASNFLLTGEEEFIETTIIDGGGIGPVALFQAGEDNTALLAGFTIRNGFSEYGGGVSCDSASPVIRNNIIVGNQGPSGYFGGGIYCSYSQARIENNSIIENIACWGGGIYSIDSHLMITGNIIADNSAFE